MGEWAAVAALSDFLREAYFFLYFAKRFIRIIACFLRICLNYAVDISLVFAEFFITGLQGP